MKISGPRKLRGAPVFGALLFLYSAGAQANECPELNEWLAAKAAVANAGTVTLKQASEAREAVLVAKRVSATHVYESYFAGQLGGPRLDECLAQEDDRVNFLNTLQNVFYEKGLEKLRASPSPAIREFIRRIDERTAGGAIPLFRLTGHFQEQSPTELGAGYARATRSIYVDFAKVPPSEWLLIFTHELLHSLDDRLPIAMNAYSNADEVKIFVEWSKQTSSYSALDGAQQGEISSWIQAGLGRGLWAEYRAWVPTFIIYQEGRADGTFPQIEWADQVLAGKPAFQSLQRYLYLFIDARSPDPSDGIFSVPLIQSSLQSVREKYRREDILPEAGSLCGIR